MFNFKDYQLFQQRQKELLRQAQQERLARQTRSPQQRSRSKTFLSRVVALFL
jgi:hypothetical protein